MPPTVANSTILITATAATVATLSLLLIGPPVKRSSSLPNRQIHIPPPTPPQTPLDASLHLSASWSFVDQTIPATTEAAAEHRANAFTAQVFSQLIDPHAFDPSAKQDSVYVSEVGSGVVVTERATGCIKFLRVPADVATATGADVTDVDAAVVGREKHSGTEVVRWFWTDDEKHASTMSSSVSSAGTAVGAPRRKIYIMEDSFTAFRVHVVVRLLISVKDVTLPGSTATTEVVSIEPQIRVVGPAGLGWFVGASVGKRVEKRLDEVVAKWETKEAR